MIIWQQAPVDDFVATLFSHSRKDISPEESYKESYKEMMLPPTFASEYLNWLFAYLEDETQKTAAVQILNNCDLVAIQNHDGLRDDFWMMYIFAYRSEETEPLSTIAASWQTIAQCYEMPYSSYREEDFDAALKYAEEQLHAKGIEGPLDQYFNIEAKIEPLVDSWLKSNGIIVDYPFRRYTEKDALEYIDIIQGEKAVALTEVAKETHQTFEIAPLGIELDENTRRLKVVEIEDVSTYQHAIFDSSVQLGL